MIDKLIELRGSGMSIAQVAKETSISHKTVIIYTKGIPRDPCKCGRPGGHKGWCEVMFALYPTRKSIVAEAAKRRRKWTEQARIYAKTAYETGCHINDIARAINLILGRSDISPHAVSVYISKLKTRRLLSKNGCRVNTMTSGRIPLPAIRQEPTTIRPFQGIALQGSDPRRDRWIEQKRKKFERLDMTSTRVLMKLDASNRRRIKEGRDPGRYIAERARLAMNGKPCPLCKRTMQDGTDVIPTKDHIRLLSEGFGYLIHGDTRNFRIVCNDCNVLLSVHHQCPARVVCGSRAHSPRLALFTNYGRPDGQTTAGSRDPCLKLSAENLPPATEYFMRSQAKADHVLKMEADQEAKAVRKAERAERETLRADADKQINHFFIGAAYHLLGEEQFGEIWREAYRRHPDHEAWKNPDIQSGKWYPGPKTGEAK